MNQDLLQKAIREVNSHLYESKFAAVIRSKKSLVIYIDGRFENENDIACFNSFIRSDCQNFDEFIFNMDSIRIFYNGISYFNRLKSELGKEERRIKFEKINIHLEKIIEELDLASIFY